MVDPARSVQRPETILVSGATGNQGGAVTHQLHAQGWHIRALSRNPEGAKALQLRAMGIEVVRGDMNDLNSLITAMQGIYGVFSVQNFMDAGVDAEVRQGIMLADAAKRTGVAHFVYSSVGGAERNSGVAHFESKGRIERHLQQIGLPATILRPVLFMENFQANFKFVMLSLIASVLGEKSIQLISVKDIGAFTALAFSNPQDYIGKALEIAGDELSFAQIHATLEQATNRRQRYIRIPSWIATSMTGEIGKMFRWFRDYGYQADMNLMQKLNPKNLSFDRWAKDIAATAHIKTADEAER